LQAKISSFKGIRFPGVQCFRISVRKRESRLSPLLSRTLFIWFDSMLEPVFSTIVVQDSNGRKVDKGNGGVNASDSTLLETSLPPLSPGTYRVIWNVVARDGHRTNGDFTFSIK